MAIKTLSTLIKVHKQQTDILRREMMALETEIHQLQTLGDRLRAEHEQEMKMVIKNPSYAGFFGAYSASVKRKLKGIDEEIMRLNRAVEEKRAAIAQEYSEQKKYEVARENLKNELLIEEKHRMQKRFDEIASQQYTARHSDN